MSSETGNCVRERRVNDRHLGADTHVFVQIDDVIRTHPNTPVTRGHTDEPFLRSSVNVDIAVKGICVLRLEPAQPENSCDDWIATGRIWQDSFSGAASILEHCTRRRVVPDFFCDLQLAQGSVTTSLPVTEPELGCRDPINSHHVATIEQR